jgi:hypothetical protein
MPRLRLVAAAILALSLAATAARANESAAEIGRGGLVLKKHDGIAMRSEDLYVSASQIRVKYVFVNTTGRDIRTIVAFPLPDINWDEPRSIEHGASFPFRTTVEGAPIKAAVELRAFKGGVEHTALLKRLRVPLDASSLTATGEALDRLPPEDRQKLLALGLVRDVEESPGEHRLAPAWTLMTTFWWVQTFPAGKPLHVEHAYTPSVGDGSIRLVGDEDSDFDPGSDELAQMRREYCVDDAFLAALARLKQETGPNGFGEQRVDYVLKTGANWKEPIGDFRLVLDKGAPANLLSVCETGLRKISPTRFEVRRTNFTPKSDLHVLILVRAPRQED